MNKKAFTIAELILVIAIIGILFGIAGNTYRNQRSRYEFNDSLQRVISLINTARNYAVTSRSAYVGNVPTIPPEGYGVYIEKSATAGGSKIILFANTGSDNNKYDNTDVIEETYTIPKATVFEALTGDVSGTSKAVIIFRPPLAEVFIGSVADGTVTEQENLTISLYSVETPKIQKLDGEGNPVLDGENHPVMIPPPAAVRHIKINKTAGFPELITGNP
ncbi:prepilin-type N-terminal cleavage/methylation domain-containing protein [Candidatus Peregrinibacteria bacterium]|nr:prepilin-type N-terminal cleavage/methylation domain-containing protein [Candidatus Peregrinibacteria bacterium]